MPTIHFDDEQLERRIPPELRQILQHMFAGDVDVKRILLSKLPGGHAGLSSLALLLAYPFDDQGSAYNPLVLRYGPKEAIAREHDNFRQYIAGRTGFQLDPQRKYEPGDTIAVIAYDFLRASHNHQPLKTLREFLWRDAQWANPQLDAACDAIRALFLNTLAQSGHKQPNGWYSDGRVDYLCPLWFYNTLLPPTITLEDVTLLRRPTAPLELANPALLERADSVESLGLDGAYAYLQTNSAYPHLELAECEQDGENYRVRLHLYEGKPVRRSIYQPFQAIAARIELVVSPDILQRLTQSRPQRGTNDDRRQGDLNRRVIQGRISDTRYRFLDNKRKLLPYQSMMVENPLYDYYRLLSAKRPLTTSIIHGDMNLSNILLNNVTENSTKYAQPQRDVFEAWLIDFDKTSSGGHTIFDAVKLETEYKVHILPHRLRSFDEVIRLERTLHEALIDPDPQLQSIKDSPQLLEAYHVIAGIRRTFLQELGDRPIAPVEYYLGLLGYGLAALKYSNLYKTNHKRWLRRYTFAEHLASFAYISASFAASVIDDSGDVSVRRGSYPRVPRTLRVPLSQRPWLVGRDALLLEAERQLLPDRHDQSRGEPRLVVFYGEPRNGRGAVAKAACVELQLAGFTLCSWAPDRTNPRTVEAFEQHILGALLDLGIRTITPDEPEHTSRFTTPSRDRHLQVMHDRLTAALEPPDSVRPVALYIHIDGSAPELRRFLARLGRELRHTPTVIVTDEPFAYEDDMSLQLEVMPLTRDDVQAYVQNEREPLDYDEIERLYVVSHGRPGLLKQIIRDARRYQQQHHVSLEEAIMEQGRIIEDEFVEEMLELMDEPKRYLIGLDALLQAYTSEAAAALDSLVKFIGPRIGWEQLASVSPEVATYLQQRQHRDDLHERLHKRALEWLQRHRDYPRLCEHIAAFFEQQPSARRDTRQIPQPYLIARFQALAGQWANAATTLRTFVDDPQLIYTAYCPKILDLTEEVYQQSETFDDRVLLELAGTCAAYLGRNSDAINYYRRLLKKVLRASDPDYVQMLARLAQVYENDGQSAEALRAGRELAARVPEQHPLHAIGRAREGLALLDSAPDQAVEALEAAIKSLEATRADWGDEQRFYEEERVYLYDTYAYACAELLPNHVADAIEHLKEVRDDARRLSAPLGAMIENNLGYIYYYVCGEDAQEARSSFKKALETRRHYGDLAGQMRSGQNLANVEVDLATSAEGWDRAEHLFQEFMPVAFIIKTADRARIIANYMHVLTLRGKFEPARDIFSKLDLDQIPSAGNDSYAWLPRNRAALALWERDVAGCRQYLALARPLAAASARAIHRIEWAQIALECHIRLGAHLDDDIADWVQLADLAEDERPIDTAEAGFAEGLLAIARGAYADALTALLASGAVWSKVKYHYRLATIGYWQVFCKKHLEQWADARLQAQTIENTLRPFGETPLRQLLAELRAELE